MPYAIIREHRKNIGKVLYTHWLNTAVLTDIGLRQRADGLCLGTACFIIDVEECEDDTESSFVLYRVISATHGLHYVRATYVSEQGSFTGFRLPGNRGK